MRILYLHRCDKDYTERLERFIKSLNMQETSILNKIDLQIVIKGHSINDLNSANRTLSKCKCTVSDIIEVQDDGFDLGAYYRAVKMISNRPTLFLNSHSWFRDRCAVELIFAAAGNISCYTLIGTSFSHSSLNWKLQFNSFSSLLFFPIALKWKKNSDATFPTAPYPHIRTTGFLCMSESLKNYFSSKKFPSSKYDCHQMESGRCNLTSFFEKNYVLFKSGLYDINKMVPGGFRSCSQGQLLINDNQVIKYDAAGYFKKWIYRYRSYP